MKVTRNTPTQLVLDQADWFIAIMLVFFTMTFVGLGLVLTINVSWYGLIFLFGGGGMGVAGLIVFIERLQVILNRESGLIKMRRRTLIDYHERTFSLDTLVRAATQSHRNNEGRVSYRPVLVLNENGDETAVPVTQIYSSGSGADRTARAINDWIAAKDRPDG